MAELIYLVKSDEDDGDQSFYTTVHAAFSNEGLAQTYRAKLALHGGSTEFYVETMELDANVMHEQIYGVWYSGPADADLIFGDKITVGPYAVDAELPPTQISFDERYNQVHIAAYGWSEAQVVRVLYQAFDKFTQERQDAS
jgi:hypothetical protein